jgi:hypothetical protein
MGPEITHGVRPYVGYRDDGPWGVGLKIGLAGLTPRAFMTLSAPSVSAGLFCFRRARSAKKIRARAGGGGPQPGLDPPALVADLVSRQVAVIAARIPVRH